MTSQTARSRSKGAAAAYRNKTKTYRRVSIALAALTAVGFAALPTFWLANTYQVRVATLVMMWMGLATAWNIVSGFTGYISFGHAALFGSGAYVVGLGTARYDLELWVALPLSFVLVGALSFFFGLLTLRIKGHYFAIATLGVAEAIRVLINYARSITEGVVGFPLPIDLILIDPKVPYYIMLGGLIAVVITAAMILSSDFGIRLLAIREDEAGAEALGINTARSKVIAFTISGAFSGFFGGMFAWILNFLSPESVLTPFVSLQVAVMVIVGGMGTIVGPLAGGLGFYMLSEFALVTAPRLNLLLLGSVLIVSMLFMRRGVFGTLMASRFWPRGFRL
ncbi:MAG: branched-chain amino acid ABC transporter permease [Acidimicrobiia bacterium]|nr:branched-chain amino acid ABC transporter permease [Acidimicrobiia bacterium]